MSFLVFIRTRKPGLVNFSHKFQNHHLMSRVNVPGHKGQKRIPFWIVKGFSPQFERVTLLAYPAPVGIWCLQGNFWLLGKMAKSGNLPKWHPHNSGWTRLLFALVHFRIFQKRLWYKLGKFWKTKDTLHYIDLVDA